MKQYLDLLDKILKDGFERDDRTNTGTVGIFGHMMKFKMADGFPLLTTKKLHIKSIIHELLWFLSGDTNIKYLNDNEVTIWNEWADYKGDLGPVYGKQWRCWEKVLLPKKIASDIAGFNIEGYDQIKNVIETLRVNPDSRRMIVSAWNVGDLKEMNLPPCHYSFQISTRKLSPSEIVKQAKKDGLWIDEGTLEEIYEVQSKVKRRAISLIWNQRSVDTFLGLPFNIASYALLLMMIAQIVNMVPDELIASLGDTHIYKNHIEQSKLQLMREPYKLPTMKINPLIKDIDNFKYEDFQLIDYQSHPHIKGNISI